jgi:Spy/CpxP family protein refolding chaperone
MFKSTRILLTVAAATLTLAGLTNTASADTTWQQNHPRREEVNNRLANQNQRIHNQVKDGDLTRKQAAQLHKDDRQVRREERMMASQNGGHITKSEQKVLNQQENGISKQIGH